MRVLLTTLLVACSGGACGGADAPVETPASTTPSAPAIASIHEWGLVSVGVLGFEFAAGPGRAPSDRNTMMVVDKPVLYVHANEATPLSVTVHLGEGMTVAEHYPPFTDGTERWNVDVNPGPCMEARSYPEECVSPDGYCETRELPLYETLDASCLTQGGLSLPLLFYRLRANTTPTLPLSVERGQNGELIVANRSAPAGGHLWRILWDGENLATHATRVAIPAVGEQIVIPRTLRGGVDNARREMREDLRELGLTTAEGEAFMRAWDAALFGDEGSTDQTPRDGLVDDRTDEPVEVSDGEGPAVDELTMDNIPSLQGGPRLADTVVYWLPPADIEALSRIEAVPPPAELRRAILVRVDAR